MDLSSKTLLLKAFLAWEVQEKVKQRIVPEYHFFRKSAQNARALPKNDPWIPLWVDTWRASAAKYNACVTNCGTCWWHGTAVATRRISVHPISSLPSLAETLSPIAVWKSCILRLQHKPFGLVTACLKRRQVTKREGGWHLANAYGWTHGGLENTHLCNPTDVRNSAGVAPRM